MTDGSRPYWLDLRLPAITNTTHLHSDAAQLPSCIAVVCITSPLTEVSIALG